MDHKITSQAPQIKKEDGLAELIGHFGKWQCIVLLTISLVKLASGWVQMAIIFFTPNLNFWCKTFENSTRIGEDMKCYHDCVEYEYDTSPFGNTIISEWDLVCSRGWLTSFTQTVLQFGILLGSILFGFLSDRYGRKKTFLLSVCMLILIGFAIPFAPDYITFTVLRFFLGVATAGTMVVSFVIIVEAVGPKYREIFGCLFQIPFTVGHMLVPVFSYFLRDWNTYSLAMAVPSVLYLGYFFVLSESPRWLVTTGKVDEATKLVTKAAKMNGLPTTKIEESLKLMSEVIQAQSENQTKPNYIDLFRGALLVKTLCTCLLWAISGMTFYGFNQYISQTSSNPFITVAVMGLIQVPAIILSIWILKKFQRKKAVMTFLVVGGLCILAIGVVPDIFWITLTLGCIGVSCVSIEITCIYIYTSEMFPTVVRNMSMGACSMSMRIGSMVAPFVSDLSTTVPWLPTVIFGVAPMIAVFICILLPETKGTVLPDSISDVNETKTSDA